MKGAIASVTGEQSDGQGEAADAHASGQGCMCRGDIAWVGIGQHTGGSGATEADALSIEFTCDRSNNSCLPSSGSANDSEPRTAGAHSNSP
jgi:hypothetical protein